jgi:spore germination cell wall hydrolase CwlJ-like protein
VGGGASSGNAVASLSERDCLIRAMYFESNRSSHDGLMAVGTVVMNRVDSPHHPDTICGVVAEHRQFAPGVLTRAMSPREISPAAKAAEAILRGERYAPVGDAMHFHVAGLRIPYRVRYVTVAGGNAFYLKTGRRFARKSAPASVPAPSSDDTQEAAIASATKHPSLMRKLYAGVGSAVAGGQSAKATCQAQNSAFGATSLACESEFAGQ